MKLYMFNSVNLQPSFCELGSKMNFASWYIFDTSTKQKKGFKTKVSSDNCMQDVSDRYDPETVNKTNVDEKYMMAKTLYVGEKLEPTCRSLRAVMIEKCISMK